MDLNALEEVLIFDEVVSNHVKWLLLMLPVIWASLAGGFVRVLILLHEPFLLRVQNALAGLILAVTLSDTTAQLLSNGNYTVGYAVMYGMVGRELMIIFYEFMRDTARPFLLSLAIYLFPFFKSATPTTKDKKEQSDDTQHH